MRGSPEYFESLQAITSSNPSSRDGSSFESGRDMDRSVNHRDLERVGGDGRPSPDGGDGRFHGRMPDVATAAHYSHDAEALRLRSRIKDLENDVRMTRDELSRTRQLLHHDRGASLKYVREIDTLQKNYSEQIVELQGLLNQSEKVRHELEIQACAILPLSRYRITSSRRVHILSPQSASHESAFNHARQAIDFPNIPPEHDACRAA
jgi:hypothetical protein